MKASLKTIVLLIGVFVVSAVSIESVRAVEYQHLGAKPAYPDPEIKDSDAWFIYDLGPGEVKEDGVEVMNTRDEAMDVRVYAADTAKSSDGGFALKQFAEEKTGVGSWIRFYPDSIPEAFQEIFESLDRKILGVCALSASDEDQILKDLKNSSTKAKKEKKPLVLEQDDWDTLAAWCEGKPDAVLPLDSGETTTLAFVIKIPTSLDVGEHAGGILVEKSVPEDMGKNEKGSAVRLTTRLGVRVYERVPGTVIQDLKLKGFSVEKKYSEFDYSSWFKKESDPEQFVITTELDNTASNTSIGFDEQLVIVNIFSGEETRLEKRNFQVQRGDSFSFNNAFNNPRLGKFAFYNEISYENAQGELIGINTEKVSVLILPWREILVAAVCMLLIACAFIAWIFVKKRKYRFDEWVEYEVSAKDDLQKIAAQKSIDWKVIAKHNRLNPPYILEAGQKIRVPADKTKKSEDSEPSLGFRDRIRGREYSLLLWIIGGMLILVGVALWMVILFSKNDNDGSVPKRVNEKSEQKNVKKSGEKAKEAAIEASGSGNVGATASASGERTKNVDAKEKQYTKKDTVIAVLNAGAEKGGARTLADHLKKNGYRIGEVDNAESEQSSEILYLPGYEDMARVLSEDVTISKYSPKITEQKTKYGDFEASIVVILGSSD